MTVERIEEIRLLLHRGHIWLDHTEGRIRGERKGKPAGAANEVKAILREASEKADKLYRDIRADIT